MGAAMLRSHDQRCHLIIIIIFYAIFFIIIIIPNIIYILQSPVETEVMWVEKYIKNVSKTICQKM